MAAERTRLVIHIRAVACCIGRGSVEHACAIQVHGQPPAARQLRHLGDVGGGQHLAAGGVLQHDESCARKVRVVGLDGGGDVGHAQRAVALRFHRLGLDGAQHRHAARLPAVSVPALAHDGLVAALAVAPQCNQVGLRARGCEECGLKTQQLRCMLLQRVHRRVVGKHIVAQRGLEHGLTHGGRGLGDGVAAKVGHGLPEWQNKKRIVAAPSIGLVPRGLWGGAPPGALGVRMVPVAWLPPAHASRRQNATQLQPPLGYSA